MKPGYLSVFSRPLFCKHVLMMFTAAAQRGFECQNLVFIYGQFSLKPSKLEITHSAQG